MNTLTASVISLDQALQRVRKAHEASWQTGTGQPTAEQIQEMDEGAWQASLAITFITTIHGSDTPTGFESPAIPASLIRP